MASFFDIKPKAPAPGVAPADDIKGAVKALKALAPVTSPDPNRGALCCVCVQERGGVPYAVATDGHVLVAARLDNGAGRALLHATTDVILAAREAKVCDDVCTTREGAVLYVPRGCKARVGCDTPVPDFALVMPRGRLSPNSGAAFDSAVLRAADRAVKGLMEVPGVQCGTYPLGIAPYVMGDPGNSTTARVWQDGDLLALVMPVRVSEYYVTTTREGVDNFFNGGSND